MQSLKISQRLVVGALLSLSASQAFSTIHSTIATSSSPSDILIKTALHMSSNNNYEEEEQVEQLLPETSFGAEAVPEEQRPVNEYLDVTKQPLFGWASNERGSQGLLIRLAITYAVSFAAVCWPIAGATYTEDGYLLQKVASANVGAITLIGFLLLRIYTGWGYLGDRLTAKVIEYEETGWYDGDWELKTDAERKRDKFLYMDKVKPVVDRLKLFSAATAGLWLASILAFNTANNMQPLYDQYDPRMLERLSYDDKLADRAASNSVGKPTYCDNRYYREVAGGKQCR